ncbi:MAG: class I SAM-dependent methyltransferase, partial [Zoogloeaceae bacterium]|nr:class I SAM-dependent methyltransferase [Zoogloeaceae bacterium]
ENVYFHLGSASDRDFMNRAFADGMFDIVVDDGSHVCGDVIATFLNLFPRLASGGVYIIEDLSTSYWENFGGGFRRDESSIEFFKHLADTVNLDHIPADALRDFSGSSLLSPDFRAMVASVSFYDSVCAVTKFHAPKTTPFLSVLTGNSAPVVSLSESHFMNFPEAAGRRFFPPWTVRCPYESWNSGSHDRIFSAALQNVENMYRGSPLAMEQAYVPPPAKTARYNTSTASAGVQILPGGWRRTGAFAAQCLQSRLPQYRALRWGEFSASAGYGGLPVFCRRAGEIWHGSRARGWRRGFPAYPVRGGMSGLHCQFARYRT